MTTLFRPVVAWVRHTKLPSVALFMTAVAPPARSGQPPGPLGDVETGSHQAPRRLKRIPMSFAANAVPAGLVQPVPNTTPCGSDWTGPRLGLHPVLAGSSRVAMGTR